MLLHFVRIVVAVCVCGPVAAAERPTEAGPVPLPDEIVVKWSAAGGQSGWHWLDERRRMQSHRDRDGVPGQVPGFTFFMPPKDLGKLPPPAVPFAVSLPKLTDATLDDLAGNQTLVYLTAWDATGVTEAGLKRLATFKNLRGVVLSGCPWSDAGLKAVADLQQLEYLSLGNSKVSAAGFKELARMKNLRAVGLTASAVTVAEIQLLAGVKRLEWVGLAHCPAVDDAGVKVLATIRTLRMIDLMGCKCTDAGVAAVAGLPHLEGLNLSSTAVTDAGLAKLAAAKGLRDLSLMTCPNVTDDGLKHVGVLTELRELYLSDCPITDAGVKSLAGLKNLRTLVLTNCPNVTDAGVKALDGLGRLRAVVVNGTKVSKSYRAPAIDLPPEPPPGRAQPVTLLKGKLQEAAAGLGDVVVLADGNEAADITGGDIARELVRQAAWMAARDGFGLRVRDAALGESAPPKFPADRVVTVARPAPKLFTSWEFATGDGTVWAGEFSPPPASGAEAEWVAEAEAKSRGLLTECFRAARFEPKPTRASKAGVPAAAAKLLAVMRETDQFAAVRLLHAAVKANGESDALTAALARGYANLGLLTRYQWTPAPAVFQARGMLYAQRLVARSPKSAAALRTRAYAFALTGFHKAALADLAAAAVLPADPDAPAEEWVAAIDAYVHFDLDRLDAARKNSPLAALLGFLAVDEPFTPTATIRAGRSYLKDQPECYLVWNSLCGVQELGNLHAATAGCLRVFGREMPARVAEQPGMPAKVLDTLSGEGASEAAFYAAIARAGESTRDAGEPSFTALATVVSNVRFAAAWNRLYFMAHSWRVETGDEAEAHAAALAAHPLRPLLQSFAADHVREPAEVRAKLTDPKVARLDFRAIQVGQRLAVVDRNEYNTWYFRATRRADATFQAEIARAHLEDVPAWRVGSSPECPQAAAKEATTGVPGPRLAELEKRYAKFPLVLQTVAQAHEKLGRAADADRCWAARLKLSPDVGVVGLRAEKFLAAGREAEWLATLEGYLATEDTGLGHAQVRVTIARHYMAAKNPKKAEPYADAAAESFAGWALLCAAECKVRLEKWDDAKAYYAAVAGRYPDNVFAWYFAARAYPKLDRVGSTAVVKEYVDGLRPLPPLQAGWVARYHLGEGRPKDALAALGKAAPAPQNRIVAALVADELGDKATRDASVKALGELAPDPRGEYEYLRAALAVRLAEWVGKDIVPDAAATAAVLKNLSPRDRADVAFFVGWYLSNRGKKEQAADLWTETVKSEAATDWVRGLARTFLERQDAAPKR